MRRDGIHLKKSAQFRRLYVLFFGAYLLKLLNGTLEAVIGSEKGFIYGLTAQIPAKLQLHGKIFCLTGEFRIFFGELTYEFD